MTKLYLYSGCDGCRRARRWLQDQGYLFEEIAIRETTPSAAELRLALAARGGQLRRLFNVSGQDYRALGLKDRLPTMPVEEAIELLRSNGNLIKRPFLVAARSALTGFDPAEWAALLADGAA